MAVRVDIQIDRPALERFLTSPAGPVGRMVFSVGRATQALASGTAPTDTGRLRSSFKLRMVSGRTYVQCTVYTDVPYSMYVHEGTGIYGPRGTPIRPRRAPFLVFPDRRNPGQFVFAREVRGQRPQRYLLDALKQASPWPVDEHVLWL